MSLYGFHCSHNCSSTTVFIIITIITHSLSDEVGRLSHPACSSDNFHLMNYWKMPPLLFQSRLCLSWALLFIIPSARTPPFIPSVVEDPFSKWLNYWWNSYDAGVLSGGLWKTHKPDCTEYGLLSMHVTILECSRFLLEKNYSKYITANISQTKTATIKNKKREPKNHILPHWHKRWRKQLAGLNSSLQRLTQLVNGTELRF